jgi:uncharacterized protein (DUF2062 family)
MARRFFRKYMPAPQRVSENRLLRIFGKALHQPNLWHLNRRSVSRAALVGLFWTMVPLPFQMIPGTACAIFMRANLGLSLVLIWLTNPITFPPLLYASYRLGRVMLRMPPSEMQMELTMQSIMAHAHEIWRPLYAGALSIGVVLAIVGYVLVRLGWRWSLSIRWKRRQRRTV